MNKYNNNVEVRDSNDNSSALDLHTKKEPPVSMHPCLKVPDYSSILLYSLNSKNQEKDAQKNRESKCRDTKLRMTMRNPRHVHNEE